MKKQNSELQEALKDKSLVLLTIIFNLDIFYILTFV